VKRILIADDDSFLLELLELTLDTGEIELLTTEDGEGALELARLHHPDLAFLDWEMPGLRGLEVCRALKSDPRTKDIAVVMLTARTRRFDRDEAREAGADAYITKPFSPVALLDKVTELLGERFVR
jgi:two-component system, OmpR family, phosphate regulon response regulator PhoB